MARTKHFPSLSEYGKWVVKQPAEMVLGTAFNGMQHPYEAYLSEYYGTSVIVVAGDCYEMNNRRYDLPAEWDGFTVGYHDCDLYEQWDEAGQPASGIEVTAGQEVAFLVEWGYISAPTRKLNAEEKKARATAKKQSNLTIQGRCQFKATGHVLIQIEDRNSKTPETFHTTIINGKVTSCINIATGETCDGRHWSGHCSHGDRALQYEATRMEELHDASVAAPQVVGEQFSQDLSAHAEDDYGHLPGAEKMISDGFHASIVPGSCDSCGGYVAPRFALCRSCSGSAAA